MSDHRIFLLRLQKSIALAEIRGECFERRCGKYAVCIASDASETLLEVTYPETFSFRMASSKSFLNSSCISENCFDAEWASETTGCSAVGGAPEGKLGRRIVPGNVDEAYRAFLEGRDRYLANHPRFYEDLRAVLPPLR